MSSPGGGHTPEREGVAPEGVLTELRAALGGRVDTSLTSLQEARADRSGHAASGAPLAVVHAESVADVQATLRIASAFGTPVVPRGAGTGLAGGAIAGHGEIALSTMRMNRVLEVRPDDLLAVVEPGIITEDLATHLGEFGLWWAPDPASRAISSVGGNIATGAGGLLCAKYGVVRDAVLGVDIVLADGRLLTLGRRSVKGVTGLDLTSLVIGSEGVLGVIVGATLKLRRRVPGTVCTLTALFRGVRAAAVASAAITASGLQPSIMELMDATSLAAVHRLLQLPAPPGGTAQLTLQTDGPVAIDEATRIADILRAAGGEVTVSHDIDEGERLLAIRRSLHSAITTLGTALIEDVSVPRSALPAMFDEIARIERQYHLTIPTVAHAGDGNLHPNFVFDGDEVPEIIWRAADDLFRSAIRLGGTLTGEHGIGILKSRWLTDELGADQWQLQRQIMQVFDPAGILNPGKVFLPPQAPMPDIVVSAAIITDSVGRVLVVRKRGTERFMQPGGKPESGENPAQTLVRELHEELSLVIDVDALVPLGRFASAAANEPGHRVVADAFSLRAEPHEVRAQAEIAELRWITPEDVHSLCLAPLSEEHLLPLAWGT